MKRAPQDCPLVFIEWEDSYQPTSKWEFLTEFDAGRVCRCASVGWMIHNGEDLLVLAPNMGGLLTSLQHQASWRRGLERSRCL